MAIELLAGKLWRVLQRRAYRGLTLSGLNAVARINSSRSAEISPGVVLSHLNPVAPVAYQDKQQQSGSQFESRQTEWPPHNPNNTGRYPLPPARALP